MTNEAGLDKEYSEAISALEKIHEAIDGMVPQLATDPKCEQDVKSLTNFDKTMSTAIYMWRQQIGQTGQTAVNPNRVTVDMVMEKLTREKSSIGTVTIFSSGVLPEKDFSKQFKTATQETLNALLKTLGILKPTEDVYDKLGQLGNIPNAAGWKEEEKSPDMGGSFTCFPLGNNNTCFFLKATAFLKDGNPEKYLRQAGFIFSPKMVLKILNVKGSDIASQIPLSPIPNNET